jgi:hypothetical protein
MLLSVPLTVTIKILLERSAAWGWVAILLDSGESLQAPQSSGPGVDPASPAHP